MIVRRLSRPLAGLLAAGIALIPAAAQSDPSQVAVQPNNYPPALPARNGPGPSVVFERIGEIPLPGPLGAQPGWLAGDQVVIPLQNGTARVAPEPGAVPATDDSVAAPPSQEWIGSSDGRRRYRTTMEGLVEAEKRRRPADAWHRAWRIVAPNSIAAPPVLIGPRLCYAGLDDRVTCVRASNGHRLWSVDLGDRLSRALACSPACTDQPAEAPIVLAVPDDGASVVALDAYDGRRIATYDLPMHHRFASSPLVVAKDRIAIARKGYEDQDAALVLLRMAPAPKTPHPPPSSSPPPVPYNGDSPSRGGASGR